MKIICLCGAQRAGKDTFGKYLTTKYPDHFAMYAFGNVLKEECALHMPKEEIGWTGTDWSGPKSEKGRVFLQEYGETKRHEKDSYWIDKLDERIRQFKQPYIVLMDSRYINEILYCVNQNGVVIYIYRESVENNFLNDYNTTWKAHPSEVQWRLWLASNPFKYDVVENNGSMEEFELNIENTGVMEQFLGDLQNENQKWVRK